MIKKFLCLYLTTQLFFILTLSWASTDSNHRFITPLLPENSFVAFCFHDIRDDVRQGIDPDPYAMNTKRLASFFDWLKKNNWHPVSLEQIIKASQGKNKLPSQAILLSFDDGLKSLYTKVFPLLKAFNYPALFALETGWLEDVNNNKTVFYNKRSLGKKDFVSWKELKEMLNSGLIEIATHTHRLHQGILANPQGNLEPAAITRAFNPKLKRYETDEEYKTRIKSDLLTSINIIKKKLGIKPKAIVWPYGIFNKELIEIARSVNLNISIGLGDYQFNSLKNLTQLGRILIVDDPNPVDIEERISQVLNPTPSIERAVQVDLDYVYDPNPNQREKNLSLLLDRIKAMHISTVYLQAFADPDGDGIATSLYFPNRYLPMRADLFNRVAWQLKTRAQVKVYAWLPLLAFKLPNQKLAEKLAVTSFKNKKNNYYRLSPFLPKSLQIVKGIYEDLSKNAPNLEGILIHDDAYLASDEDATACKKEARWPGTDIPLQTCTLSPREKTLALINFSQEAIKTLKYYQNLSTQFKSARNLFARTVVDPKTENRFAQALGPFLTHYDQVVLMAMPYLEQINISPEKWFEKLVKEISSHPRALNKVVFELQAQDWNKKEWIKGSILANWMEKLIKLGVLNLAYYPDDFLNNRPSFQDIYPVFSLNIFPHRRTSY